MVSQEARDLLKQLVSEGVSPWLSARGPEEFETSVRPPVLGVDFHNALAPPGSALTLLQRTCDLLRPVFEATEGAVGHVSVPVSPRWAHDAHSLRSAARALHGQLARPNVLVRIPATPAGLKALADCLAEGIGVHASMVFSAERYAEVLDAYVDGLERSLASGRSLGEALMVASFPVGVFDAEVESRLDGLGVGPGDEVRGAAGLAVARAMYRLREQRLSGGWWRVLRANGAPQPRLLWTSGGTDVGALIGWNTALALSVDTLEEAARGPNLSGDTLLTREREAKGALVALERLGIPLARVADVLETAELGRLQHDWDVMTRSSGAAPAAPGSGHSSVPGKGQP
ncbi:transaldolase family protein [Streptomyces sp. NBC_01298]|uniref:transaldolase family protein n=1 Tax=Streptomyces sp. NBC_01298 TaxID=2903817 RepID=UPI002E0F186E|nr:transaldolase family protein [Streptomyces sp. NBC_01298]